METTIEAPAAPALNIALPHAIPNKVASDERAAKYLNFVKSIEVTTPEQYQEAAEELARVKGRIKAAVESRDAILKPIKEAEKQTRGVFSFIATLESAETILKTTLTGYMQLEERRAQEAQAAAEREARRQREEAEAKAREAEAKARAETDRIQREADAKAAALKAEAEAAAASGNEEQAAALQAQAEEVTSVAVAQVEEVQEEAAAIVTAKQMEAEVVMPAVVAPAMTKVAGLSSAKKWKGKVVDLRALLQAALTDDTLFALIDINESRLNSLARTLNGAATKPGIEFYPDTTIRSRAA